MICSWIINVIGPKLHTSIAYQKTATVMWKNLQKRYVVPNTPKIHKLKTNIAASKQSGLEVVEFYSKLMAMWIELNNYVKIPQCTCGKCECGVGGKVVKLMEEEHTHHFIMGLEDKSYANIRSQVLAFGPSTIS